MGKELKRLTRLHAMAMHVLTLNDNQTARAIQRRITLILRKDLALAPFYSDN